MRNFRFLVAAMRTFKVLLAAAFLLSTSSSVNAQSPPNNSERQLFESLNRERAARSLPALQWDESLFKAARHHALRMLNLNRLEHQLPGEPDLTARLTEVGARFSAIAENIAVGPNPSTIHAGWMGSPGHRKNILSPDLTAVGIAAVRGTGGLFAVQDFSQPVANLTVEQQEQKIVSLLTEMGWRLTDATEDARKTCKTDQGLVGSKARSMVRFELSDLSRLPEDIERAMRSKPYRTVAVGACRADRAAAFARYRITILFF
jgi:Cysteine-rich secretory protein family